MTRFRLTVEYDGAPFMGWQRQAHGPTVQGAIEDAVRAAFGEEVTLSAAGRTDAGVHALAMSAHVDLKRDITPFRLQGAINAHLRPQPVAIVATGIAPADWHARFSCIGRRYEYRIVERRAPLALEDGRAWRIAGPLDSGAMAEAAAVLVGRHDFTTFRSAHCQADSPVRTLDLLNVARTRERITIRATARSFLHHQVRSMVGCLALVGQGRWRPEDVRTALDARDRSALGLNAPAEGLFFVEALYPLLDAAAEPAA